MQKKNIRYKKRTRFLAAILSSCLVVPLMPVSAFAESEGVEINETNFPDSYFRQYVSENADLNHDGILSETEIEQVKAIEVIGSTVAGRIEDLKGIEYFTALERLRCNSNSLTSLDLSNNSELEYLICYANELASLDLGNKPVLKTLNCGSNELTSLDLSNSPALEDLECYYNNLTSLNLSNSPALERLRCDSNSLTSLILSNNSALKYLVCYFNNLSSLDLSNSPALEELRCDYNKLTSLDLSNNPKLNFFYCFHNELTSLDLGNKPVLDTLNCESNNLTSLDLSNSPALEGVSCGSNNLTSLDLSNKPALERLSCGSNDLTSLDLSNSPALERLGCWYNNLSSLDLSNKPALENLDCRHNKLTYLDLGNCPALEDLKCSDNLLIELNVSRNTGLTRLECHNNQLTSLNISSLVHHKPGITGLNNVYFVKKDTTGIFDLNNLPGNFDITKASGWEGGWVDGSILTLYASSNMVTYDYDIGKGDSLLFTLAFYDSEISPALRYVEINSDNFPDSEFCNYVKKFDTNRDEVLSPDELFEVMEIDLSGFSQIRDLKGIEYFCNLQSLNCGWSGELTSLDVSQNTALRILDCSWNQLESLDVSRNKNLESLYCSENKLENLDVSQNIRLVDLDCNNNELTSLDVSRNTALRYLVCYSNSLNTLDLRQNTALRELDCNCIGLTSLDLSQNTALQDLNCKYNQLTSLDLDKNSALQDVDCSENEYSISTNYDRTYDLNHLPGGFDVTKASDWQGGTVSGTILTVNEGTETITYTYDLGQGETEVFALKVTVPVAPVYEITVTDSANGSVTASSLSASAGTSVTLSVIPANGYHFEKWKVLSGDTEIAVVDNIFEMPEGNVTVEAVFEKDAGPIYNGEEEDGKDSMPDSTQIAEPTIIPEPTKPAEVNSNGAGTDITPKTGDNNSVLFFCILCVVSLSAVSGMVICGIKKGFRQK